ncbi:MAG: TetR/AcrR family transcriptional regulator [Oscillospiraceae bacterium]|nr:TetR/AcrR family transcriptional regulator [Oscillospiraceae bacterium]
MKQDKRYIKTEKLIHNAFFELLKDESYNSITVEKICENAFIGKNTFYSHYKNKDDFLFCIINRFSKDYMTDLENCASLDVHNDRSVEVFIESFFSSVKNHVNEYSLLMKNDSQINFSERLLVYGRNFFVEHLEKFYGSKITDIKSILLMDSLASAILRLQRGYVLHQNEVSFDEIVELAKKSYKDVVKQINSF